MRTCHDMKEEMKYSKLKKKCRERSSGQKESKHLLFNSEEGSPCAVFVRPFRKGVFFFFSYSTVINTGI